MKKRKIDFSKYDASVNMAVHAIGLNFKKPICKYGALYYHPFKNCFLVNSGSNEEKVWESMVSRRLATVLVTDLSAGITTFKLTQEGLDWLGEKIGVKICGRKTQSTE